MKPHSNRRPIKVNKLIRISGALAGIIMANPFTAYASPPAPAPSASPVITWTATGKQSEKNVDVLFVQNAKNVSFSEGKLVPRGELRDGLLYRSSCAHGRPYADQQVRSALESGKG
jgi:hypothetical protein